LRWLTAFARLIFKRVKGSQRRLNNGTVGQPVEDLASVAITNDELVRAKDPEVSAGCPFCAAEDAAQLSHTELCHGKSPDNLRASSLTDDVVDAQKQICGSIIK
jgi:hypothetical protein